MHSNRFFCGVVSLFGLCAAAFAQPANDRCENAAPLGLGTFLFANLGATNESPDNPCGLDGDVWYKFTAPDSGTVTITTCGLGSLDSVVALYVGECATRSYIDCNDDSDCGSGNTGHSTVQFTAHIGVSYLVRVGGYGTPRGTGALTVTLTPDATSQITYQGRLDMTSAPYTGPADLRFSCSTRRPAERRSTRRRPRPPRWSSRASSPHAWTSGPGRSHPPTATWRSRCVLRRGPVRSSRSHPGS